MTDKAREIEAELHRLIEMMNGVIGPGNVELEDEKEAELTERYRDEIRRLNRTTDAEIEEALSSAG